MSEELLLGAAIIGTIQAIKSITGVNGWITILIAAGLGFLAGWANIDGLNPITGLLSGLASVGTMTIAGEVTNK